LKVEPFDTNDDANNVNKIQENKDNSDNIQQGNENITTANSTEIATYPIKPSQSSQPSPTEGAVANTLENNRLKKFTCFYCDECFASDIERVSHIDDEHQGKLHYPTPEDFKNRNMR
jgi:hypothetical protein